MRSYNLNKSNVLLFCLTISVSVYCYRLLSKNAKQRSWTSTESDHGLSRFTKEDVDRIKNLALARYSKQRKTIREACRKHHRASHPNKIRMDRWSKTLRYDFHDKLLFCLIPKDASNTWLEYLNKLRVPDYTPLDQLDRKTRMVERRAMNQQLYTLPNDTSMNEAFKQLVSFSFVRHPLSRLVSGYNQVFVNGLGPVGSGNLTNNMKRKRSSIAKYSTEKIALAVENYNEIYNGDENETFYPYLTPSEFVNYLLGEMEESRFWNVHFRPQWLFCPFCFNDFDIVGKVERFQEDFEFIRTALNLEAVWDQSLQLNTQHQDPQNEITRSASKLSLKQIRSAAKADEAATGAKETEAIVKFYSGIPRYLVKQLYKVYQIDFEMFGYSYEKFVRKYIPHAL